MRVPASASPDVQEALRDLQRQLDSVLAARVVDFRGRRVANAGSAVGAFDYVTLTDLRDAIAAGSGSGGNDVRTLTVRQLLRILGEVSLPAFTDGTNHHAILFVDSAGNLAVNEDGAQALDLNISASRLELGYGLTLYWFNQAGISSPSVGVVKVVAADGVTEAEITAKTFVPIPQQAYTPTNVSTLRTGDFSTLSAADVRSMLGTLIQDLKAAGMLG